MYGAAGVRVQRVTQTVSDGTHVRSCIGSVETVTPAHSSNPQRRYRPLHIFNTQVSPSHCPLWVKLRRMSAGPFPLATRPLDSGSGTENRCPAGRPPLNTHRPWAEWLSPKSCMPCAACHSPPPISLCISGPPHEELGTLAIGHARDEAVRRRDGHAPHMARMCVECGALARVDVFEERPDLDRSVGFVASSTAAHQHRATEGEALH